MGEGTLLLKLPFPDAQRVFNRLYYQRGGKYAEDFTTATSRGPKLAYAEAEDFYKYLCSLKKKGELPGMIRILDFGCGNGNGSAFFLDKLKELDEKGRTGFFGTVECVLADFSAQMLEDAKANKHLSTHSDVLRFAHTNAEAMSVPGNDYLLVRSNELLDDLPTQMLIYDRGHFYEIWLALHLSERVPLRLLGGTRVARNDFIKMAANMERELSSVDGSFVKHLELEAERRKAVPDLSSILLLMEEFVQIPDGLTIPVPLAGASTLMQLRPLLHRHGRIDAFDYGFSSLSELKVLQPAIYRTPGALTAFVNFPYLRRIAKMAGFRSVKVEPQSKFMGGKARKEDEHFHHIRLEA